MVRSTRIGSKRAGVQFDPVVAGVFACRQDRVGSSRPTKAVHRRGSHRDTSIFTILGGKDVDLPSSTGAATCKVRKAATIRRPGDGLITRCAERNRGMEVSCRSPGP